MRNSNGIPSTVPLTRFSRNVEFPNSKIARQSGTRCSTRQPPACCTTNLQFTKISHLGGGPICPELSALQHQLACSLVYHCLVEHQDKKVLGHYQRSGQYVFEKKILTLVRDNCDIVNHQRRNGNFLFFFRTQVYWVQLKIFFWCRLEI